MVHIDDAVHILVEDIVDHFFDAVHPCVINISSSIHVRIPRDGHADGIEASHFHHLHQLHFRDGLTSHRFCLGHIGNPNPMGIEGVAQVPPHFHILNSLRGSFKLCALCVEKRCHRQQADDGNKNPFIHHQLKFNVVLNYHSTTIQRKYLRHNKLVSINQLHTCF